MIILLISMVWSIAGDTLYSGSFKGVEVSKRGIFPGMVIEKKFKGIKGKIGSDWLGDYAGADGNIYYRGRLIKETDALYFIFAPYKDKIVCLGAPYGTIYYFKNGKEVGSLNLKVSGVMNMTVIKNVIYYFVGGKGSIYKIKDQKQSIFFSSQSVNVTGLKFHRGKFYISTSQPGMIYERFPDGKKRIYFDPKLDEVTSFGFMGDTLFVSGIYSNAGQTKGKVIAVFRGEEKTIYDGTPIISGDITKRGFMGGEGEDGQIAIFHWDMFSLIADLDEKKIVRIRRTRNGVMVSAGDPAGFYLIKYRKNIGGYYITPTIDGGEGVRWGRVYTDSKGKIGLYYRSGRSSKVDSSWTEWKKIENPLNTTDRFVQIKTVLNASNSFVKEILVHYQEYNHPPVIKKLSVLPPGVGYGNSSTAPFDRRTIDQNEKKRFTRMGFFVPDGAYIVPIVRMRCVYWDVSDLDGDVCEYDLYMKKEGEKKYKMLGEHLNTPGYFFDTSPYPDGRYIVKLITDDKPTAVFPKSSRDSIDFIIDNTPPELVSFKAKDGVFKGTVKDNLSLIQAIYYMFPEGEWKVAYPSDGVYDETQESFYFKYNKKGNCSVRVVDRMGNSKIFVVKVK